MDHDGDVICSFCGEPGSPERALARSLGATICVPCLDHFHAMARNRPPRGAPPPWESMSDEELLAALPLILRTARQVEDHATTSVELLRERKVTWAAIGEVLGVSRQAAWERFSKRPSTRAASR